MSIIVPTPQVWAPRPWRDFRDGASPPAFHSLLRRGIAGAVEHNVPPLTAEDIVILLGLYVAGRYMYPLLPSMGETPLTDAAGYLDVRGVMEVVAADPEFATHAGFPVLPSPVACEDYTRVKLERWMEEDLRAARGGPWGTRVDDSPRGRAIAFQYEEYERLVYRPNHVVSARNLTDVVVDNVGGNEWDARRREKIQPKVLAGWLRFLAEKEDFSAELMEINEDGLSLRLDETRQALKKQLGEGVRRRDVRSLDADPPEARAQLRSDRPRPDTHAVLEEASAVARDLRDLRDARDLAELHPHLNVLVEGALRSPEQLFGFMPWLRALLKRFEVQDAATQAAMIFELGCGPGRKPRWTRENVARHYAVTPRQVSYRGQLARKLIPQLPAA